MLFVLSGFLVLFLDSRSAGKTVTEPVIEAIMLDNSRVIEEDDANFGNAVDVRKANGSLQKRLRLEYSSRPGVEGGNCHAILVP